MKMKHFNPVEHVRKMLNESLAATQVKGAFHIVKDGETTVFELRVSKMDFYSMTHMTSATWQSIRTIVDSLGKANLLNFRAEMREPTGFTWTDGIKLPMDGAIVTIESNPNVRATSIFT